jgi:hypothetical protein
VTVLSAATLLAAVLLAALARPGAAQTVQGQLIDASTGAPIAGVLVRLLTEAGDEAGGYLTNEAGRFTLQAPDPGVYTLRAERIGYETVTSDPFTLERAQRFGIRLETAQTAIQLEELRVEGSQQCVVRPAEGLQLAAVWEEARKALTVQDWTEREGSYRFQVTRYERQLDAMARVVESETRQVLSGVAGLPIRSLPAEDLMAKGFVRPSGNGGYDYFGPDASVLLSDQFLDTHCLRLTTDPDRWNEVGLAFEPVRRGGIPDIAGTLWLDAETARLRVLDYTYTWSPWEEVRGAAKGRVEFENLPSGAWVIQKWWIQMPMVAMDMTMALMQKTGGIRLVGIREVGGGITRFTSSDLDQAETSEVPKGVLRGQVWDSTRQIPLAGAAVFLSGTQYSAETDAGGSFLMSDLPGGVFQAVFTHPRLDSLGVFSRGEEVEIIPGEFTTLMLGIPSTASILASTCAEHELEEGPSAVIGVVREAGTDAPIEGATVTVSWSTFSRGASGGFAERRHGLQITTGSAGRYAACGVPFDATLHIKATHLDRETETVQVDAEKNGVSVVHLIFPG